MVANKDISNKCIEMYFGNPFADDFRKKLEGRAIEWERSIQFILLNEFEHTFNHMIKTKKFDVDIYGNHSLSVFDSYCVYFANTDGVFYAPPVKLGTYVYKGSKYSKLILKDGWLRNEKKKKEFPLTDSVIEKLGKQLEEGIGFEFIEFKRL